MKNSNIEVSIICTAYNHEEYIADALEGFLSQKTEFRFEVVVSDDASTDSTASIIRKYERMFPDIVKPIYFEENQYSQGRRLLPILINHAQGKYLALCEGDDFWTDPLKLQAQYDMMESHPDCTFCFTNAEKVDASSGKSDGLMLPSNDLEKDILSRGSSLHTDDLIQIDFIPTATFFFPKEAYYRIPDIPAGAFSGDRAKQLFLTHLGSALYVDKVTSVYRTAVPNSMMTRWRADDKALAEASMRYVRLYEFFNDFTKGQYRELLEPQIEHRLLDAMLAAGDPSLLDHKKALSAARRRGLKYFAKYSLLRLSPSLYATIRKAAK